MQNANSDSAKSQEEQQLDQMIEQAVEAAAKGENIEQLLEVMLSSFSPKMKERIQKKFAAALAKRKLRAPAADADIPSQGAIARIRKLFEITSRQAMDRIAALVRSRPDIATRIEQAGIILARNGVVQDNVQVSEADLGNMAPATGVKQTQDRGTGRS